MKRIFLVIVLLLLPVIASATTLVWVAPTTNADGTPLIDLAGYKVTIGDLPQVDVGNVLSYSVALPAGSYPYSVIAYDTVGNESGALTGTATVNDPHISIWLNNIKPVFMVWKSPTLRADDTPLIPIGYYAQLSNADTGEVLNAINTPTPMLELDVSGLVIGTNYMIIIKVYDDIGYSKLNRIDFTVDAVGVNYYTVLRRW